MSGMNLRETMETPATRRLIVVLTALALMISGAMSSGVMTASAQEPGMLVIAEAECPPGLTSEEIDPADCNVPAAGVEYFIGNPGTGNIEFGSSEFDGMLSFPLDPYAINPDGAAVNVGVLTTGHVYGEVTGYAVSCTGNGEPLEFTYQEGEVAPGGPTLEIQFTAFEGDQIACDWYNSFAHPDLDNGAPDNGENGENGAPEDDEAPPVSDLPEVGAGTMAETGQPVAWLVVASLIALAGSQTIRRRLS